MRSEKEQAGPAPASDDDIAITSLDAPDTPPHGLPRAHRGWRARAATLAASALLVAMVLVGLFTHATSDPGAALATLLQLPTATPAATFVPGANVFYFSNGAPWGTLSVDGKRLPSPDLTGYGIAVTRGIHHLVYQARYFPSLRCTFSAPSAFGGALGAGACPYDTTDASSQFLLGKGLARIINLGSTGATLQSDQRAALTQLANRQLETQSLATTIQPGDRYVDAQGQIATATAPLHFLLTLAISEPTGPVGAGFCTQFCPDPGLSSGGLPVSSGWPMRVSVASFWAITDASGRPLTGPAYQAGLSYPESSPILVGVQLTANGWRINGMDRQNTGAIIDASLMAVDQAVNAVISGVTYGASVNVGQQPLDGCVMDVTLAGMVMRVFWRFGILLAIDTRAHQIFPALPVATAAEQALAARIMQQQPHP